MHVINLGVALWVVGSCFKLVLLDFPGVWGPGDDTERLRQAHACFKQWAHDHKVPPLCRIVRQDTSTYLLDFGIAEYFKLLI